MFLPTKYSKFFKKIRYLLLVLLTSVILIFLLNTSRTGYAENPRPTVATFSEIRGTVRVYPNGNAQQRITPNRDFRMNSNNNDQLWVAATTPRSSSWADILFREQEQVIDPVVRVGGASTSTVYRFPCWVEQPGSSLFGWGFEKVGAACDTVTANIVSVEESIAQKSSSPKISDEAASKQITISRLEDVTLIHVYNKDGDVAVDVLVGAVRITALNGSIFNVNAGNRYIQSAELGGTDPLDLSEASESPSVEDFLDETSWPSEVKPLLDNLKAQLPITSQLTETQQEILDTHNELRAEVDVPSLSWSPELASAAQEWADTLSRENDFRHSDGSNGVSGAGENIAAGNSVGRMLRLWSSEKEDFDLSSGQCRRGETCGHYSQMIWRRTTELGCGVAPHRRYGNVMVCNYSPPGNVIGRSPLQ